MADTAGTRTLLKRDRRVTPAGLAALSAVAWFYNPHRRGMSGMDMRAMEGTAAPWSAVIAPPNLRICLDQ